MQMQLLPSKFEMTFARISVYASKRQVAMRFHIDKKIIRTAVTIRVLKDRELCVAVESILTACKNEALFVPFAGSSQ